MDKIRETCRIPGELKKLYSNIYTRCYCKSYHAYHRYGGRGISVCDEWLSDRNAFFNWCIENGHSKGLVLDRKNNDIGYSPDNCRFLTKKESCRNRSSNRSVTINGETKLLCEWIELHNINKPTFYERLKRGWSFEDAIVIPVKNISFTDQ